MRLSSGQTLDLAYTFPEVVCLAQSFPGTLVPFCSLVFLSLREESYPGGIEKFLLNVNIFFFSCSQSHISSFKKQNMYNPEICNGCHRSGSQSCIWADV